MSTSCPGCHKSVLLEDIVVKGYKGVTNLETCGKLIVGRRGHAVAKNRIVAHSGIEVKGRVQCGHALTASRVTLFGKSEWRGDLGKTGSPQHPPPDRAGGGFQGLRPQALRRVGLMCAVP